MIVTAPCRPAPNTPEQVAPSEPDRLRAEAAKLRYFASVIGDVRARDQLLDLARQCDADADAAALRPPA